MNEKLVALTVLIITKDEEVNIRYALDNVTNWAQHVVVLDSGSVDSTVEICNSFGVEVYFREFDDYASQRTHAMKNLPLKTDWVLFLDADEYLLDDLKDEISGMLNAPAHDGYYLRRRFYFSGKWIKFGGYYPTNILRLFKRSKASISRKMNEHIIVDGTTTILRNDFVDDNKKGIHDWIIKHNKYASFEAFELLNAENSDHQQDQLAKFFGNQVEQKRWIRQNIWNRLLPPLIRPFLYYFYRYIIRLGFLDGKQGFIYHFLHALYYRMLIDIKYIELKNKRLD